MDARYRTSRQFASSFLFRVMAKAVARPDQLLVTTPSSVLYQLGQSPAHTVFASFYWSVVLNASSASGVTSITLMRSEISRAMRFAAYSAWRSSMKMMELCPRLVFGP